MEADDPVTVYTVNDPYKAQIIKTALEGEGIACELDGERQAGLAEILEIGVLVRARDADHARRIIESAEARGHEHEETEVIDAEDEEREGDFDEEADEPEDK